MGASGNFVEVAFRSAKAGEATASAACNITQVEANAYEKSVPLGDRNRGPGSLIIIAW